MGARDTGRNEAWVGTREILQKRLCISGLKATDTFRTVPTTPRAPGGLASVWSAGASPQGFQILQGLLRDGLSRGPRTDCDLGLVGWPGATESKEQGNKPVGREPGTWTPRPSPTRQRPEPDQQANITCKLLAQTHGPFPAHRSTLGAGEHSASPATSPQLSSWAHPSRSERQANFCSQCDWLSRPSHPHCHPVPHGGQFRAEHVTRLSHRAWSHSALETD